MYKLLTVAVLAAMFAGCMLEGEPGRDGYQPEAPTIGMQPQDWDVLSNNSWAATFTLSVGSGDYPLIAQWYSDDPPYNGPISGSMIAVTKGEHITFTTVSLLNTPTRNFYCKVFSPGGVVKSDVAIVIAP